MNAPDPGHDAAPADVPAPEEQPHATPDLAAAAQATPGSRIGERLAPRTTDPARPPLWKRLLGKS